MLCAFADEKKEDKKKEAQSRSWTIDEPWRPLIWNPYSRQPLYTWWAAPWMAQHHHHHDEPLYHDSHHSIHHHDQHHHLEAIPVPIVTHPVPAPIPYHHQHHQHHQA